MRTACKRKTKHRPNKSARRTRSRPVRPFVAWAWMALPCKVTKQTEWKGTMWCSSRRTYRRPFPLELTSKHVSAIQDLSRESPYEACTNVRASEQMRTKRVKRDPTTFATTTENDDFLGMLMTMVGGTFGERFSREARAPTPMMSDLSLHRLPRPTSGRCFAKSQVHPPAPLTAQPQRLQGPLSPRHRRSGKVCKKEARLTMSETFR